MKYEISILAIPLVILLVAIAVTLWWLVVSYHRTLTKNRELYEIILRKQRREECDRQRKAESAVQVRPSTRQLYQRICDLMRNEQLYTDSELNRDALAATLGTNHRYVDEAIRKCAGGLSTNAFINSYRIDHAAHMLTETDEPIALIAEMSGFANRTSFNNLFRERFRMTPSEARRAARS